jgi:hypothetical protein
MNNRRKMNKIEKERKERDINDNDSSSDFELEPQGGTQKIKNRKKKENKKRL